MRPTSTTHFDARSDISGYEFGDHDSKLTVPFAESVIKKPLGGFQVGSDPIFKHCLPLISILNTY